METVEELTELANTIPNPILNEWKNQGKPIVGFFCRYIPEEILHAGGILPYRVRARGCEETTLADTLMSTVNCSFTRACLELALRGTYQFLDGLVSMNSCEHIHRLYSIWKYKISSRFFHFLSVPHKLGEEAVDWYRVELEEFKQSIEEFFSVNISDEQLRNSINTCNETRELLKRLYEFQKRKNPPLSGVEVQDIVVAATTIPKEEYNRLLRGLLAEVGEREGLSDYRARLMVIGVCLDDSALTGIIEELGGLVVTDALCFGSYYFWEQVEAGEKPLEGLACSYLNQPSCPRIVGEHTARLDFINEMVKSFQVDGIIFERLRNCDLWGGETLVLQKGLQELGIPLLILDREYILSGMGQIRTRIQAFLEMVEGG